uniref:Nudix hydrolase domain-containing protein n=3 Tax=Glossina TaxID=44049 RepID=A0A1B0AE84_GLOPL
MSCIYCINFIKLKNYRILYNNSLNETSTTIRTLAGLPNNKRGLRKLQTILHTIQSLWSSLSLPFIPKPTSPFTTEQRLLSDFHRLENTMETSSGVFKGILDRFQGITVESEHEFNATDDFPEKLKRSLDYWQRERNRAIWFKVSEKHSNWIPALTKNGFQFHNARNGYLTLVRWLPENEYKNLPPCAHTMLGVGGLVVNKQRKEILVVSDRYALIPNSWKLPGGFTEPKENLVESGIREVHEETGIETEYETMISIRHSHGGLFDTSDLYFVMALTPKNFNIKRDEREISKAKWMPFEEYLNHPNVHETNRHFLRIYLDYQKCGLCFVLKKAKHQILKKEYCLYFIKSILEESDEEEGSFEGKSYLRFRTNMTSYIDLSTVEKSMAHAGTQLCTMAHKLHQVERCLDCCNLEELDDLSMLELLESMHEVRNEYQNLRKDIQEVQQLQRDVSTTLRCQLRTMHQTYQLLKKRLELKADQH